MIYASRYNRLFTSSLLAHTQEDLTLNLDVTCQVLIFFAISRLSPRLRYVIGTGLSSLAHRYRYLIGVAMVSPRHMIGIAMVISHRYRCCMAISSAPVSIGSASHRHVYGIGISSSAAQLLKIMVACFKGAHARLHVVSVHSISCPCSISLSLSLASL